MPLLDGWPEGFRYEVSDGVLEGSPPPDIGHQDIAELLQRQLMPQLPRVWQVSLARPVATSQGWRIPDLLVRSCPRGAPPTGVEAFPAVEVSLVAEVESPSGLRCDRVVQREKYAEAGIAS